MTQGPLDVAKLGLVLLTLYLKVSVCISLRVDRSDGGAMTFHRAVNAADSGSR